MYYIVINKLKVEKVYWNENVQKMHIANSRMITKLKLFSEVMSNDSD